MKRKRGAFRKPVFLSTYLAASLTVSLGLFGALVAFAAQRSETAAPPDRPARSLSMVAADFDEDGVADLAVGYALEEGGSITLMRGNHDAVAPETHASWLAAGRHEMAAPFLPSEASIHLTEAPDIMAAADVDGDGHLDLVYASKSSRALHVLLGSGKDGFRSAPLSISLPGFITALASYRPGPPVLGEALLVGYQSKHGAGLAILSYGPGGMRISSTYLLPGQVTAFAVANLDGDLVPDTAIVAGGQLSVLHGHNALNGKGRVETTPLDNVEAITTGEFLFDRHGLMQLAALTSDGSVLILAHQGFDPRPFTPQEIKSTRHLRPGSPTLAQLAGNSANEPWTVVETNARAGAHPTGSDVPILLRTRMSGGGDDDLVVLNSSQQQRVTIRHSMGTSRGSASSQGRMATANLYSSDELAAAVSARVTADARFGLVMLKKNSPLPEFSVPAAGNTFYVNTFADNTGNSTDPPDSTRCSNGGGETCTLRDAVSFVNLDASDNMANGNSDTIMLPAGTYPLTWKAGAVDANGNAETHLEVLGPVTFIGDKTSPGVTIDASSNDVAFTINPGPYGSFNPSGDSYVFDTELDNITIKNGSNPNNLTLNSLANDVGGGINWDAFGTGNLTLDNVTIEKCTVLYGAGGGLWVENSAGSGSGTVTLTGDTISGNETAEEGGGIYDAFPYAALKATNTLITNNQAKKSVNASDPGGFGAGGGLYFDGRTSASGSPQSTLNGVTISSNSTDQEGGAIYTNSGILVTNSTIKDNSSGGSGGGVYAEEDSDETTTTISDSNILNNSATTTGGGAFVGDDNPSTDVPSLTLSRDRIVGNTSTNGTSGLALKGSGAALAKYNWWGCNKGPSGSPCDEADSAASTNPWAVLSIIASPSSIVLGNDFNVTVGLDSDSNGAGISGAFPAVTTENFTWGSTGITGAFAPSPGTFDGSGEGTATFTPSDGGSGSVQATFDNQTVSAEITVQVKVPNVVGDSQAAATSAINNDSLVVGTVTQRASTTVPSGDVISQSPKGGATVNAGSSVNLVVSIGATPATLTSPNGGSTLAGPSVTFSWTTPSGATGYRLVLGSTAGNNNLYGSGLIATSSTTANWLPTNGETIYATLYTSYGSIQVSSSATYTAATQSALTSPSANTVLSGPTVTFNWNSAAGATGYAIRLGSTVGGNDYWSSGHITATSATAKGLPTNGGTVYARLYTEYGSNTGHIDYTFTAATRAALTSPTGGSVLTGTTETFNWTTAAGATGYALRLGTTVGGNDIWSSGPITTTSAVAKKLPTNGSTVYARLYTVYGSTEVYTDYTFTASTAP